MKGKLGSYTNKEGNFAKMLPYMSAKVHSKTTTTTKCFAFQEACLLI